MMRMKIRGTNSARRLASSFVHGVVSVSRTTSETEVATLITISPADVRPCEVTPTALPFQCHRGSTIVPGVMKLSVAGSTMMPVKIGMNSHTRLTKKPTGSAESAASRSVPAYMASSTGMFRTSAVDDQQAEQRHDLDARVDLLQQAVLRGDVLAEHRLAHHARGAAQGLLDEAALLALADAPARAQRDLACHEPLRRGVAGSAPGTRTSLMRRLLRVVASGVLVPRPWKYRIRPTMREDHDRDDRDADDRRDQVADHRVVAAAEPVAAEHGMAPERAELVQPASGPPRVRTCADRGPPARPRRTRPRERGGRAASAGP